MRGTPGRDYAISKPGRQAFKAVGKAIEVAMRIVTLLLVDAQGFGVQVDYWGLCPTRSRLVFIAIRLAPC